MKKIIFSISLFIILMFGSSGVEGMSELDNLVNSTSENIEHSAALAIDGDYNTYWEANETEDQSLLIDLEEVREINSVVQIFNQEDKNKSFVWILSMIIYIKNLTGKKKYGRIKKKITFFRMLGAKSVSSDRRYEIYPN